MKRLYRDLIRFRKKAGIPGKFGKKCVKICYDEQERWLVLSYRHRRRGVFGALFYFGQETRAVRWPFPASRARVIMDSNSRSYGGRGRVRAVTMDKNRPVLLDEMGFKLVEYC